MKIFAKVFSWVITTATILIILICVGIMGPKLFGLNPYIATSGSMQPTIETGSLVYVNTKDTTINPNDIIMFNIPSLNENSHKTVTHRVIGTENGAYITKGDANEERDSNTVSQEQIVGKYAYHIPKLGYIYDSVGYKGLIVIAVWVIILNVISMILTHISKPKSENGEEEKINLSPQSIPAQSVPET